MIFFRVTLDPDSERLNKPVFTNCSARESRKPFLSSTDRGCFSMTMSINFSSILWSEVFDAIACFLTAVAVAFVVPSNFALPGVFGVVGPGVLRNSTVFWGVDGVLVVC